MIVDTALYANLPNPGAGPKPDPYLYPSTAAGSGGGGGGGDDDDDDSWKKDNPKKVSRNSLDRWAKRNGYKDGAHGFKKYHKLNSRFDIYRGKSGELYSMNKNTRVFERLGEFWN